MNRESNRGDTGPLDTVNSPDAGMQTIAPYDDGPAPPGARLQCLAITGTLTAAALDPGAGGLVALLLSGLIWLIHVSTWQSETVDLLVSVAVGITLLSPFWHLETTANPYPAVAAAISLVFFVAVRIVVTDRVVFRELISQVGIVCTLYAAYFLLYANPYDLINDRATVSFANANYTGAVLTFGVAVTGYLAFSARPGNGRTFYIASVLLGVLAIYQSGSRSSFAGAALALLVLAMWRRAGRWVRPGVLIAAVTGFFLALAPSSIDLFARVAAHLAPFGTFQRGLESAQDASGRQLIWVQAREILDWAWLTGWGPGNYFRPVDEEAPTFLTHSWAMEYLLSVGVLGTIFIAVVLYLAYTQARGGHGALWTAVTMASLLPSLVFSTHQWTIWAWFAFALWSRADLLDSSSTKPEVSPPARPGTT